MCRGSWRMRALLSNGEIWRHSSMCTLITAARECNIERNSDPVERGKRAVWHIDVVFWLKHYYLFISFLSLTDNSPFILPFFVFLSCRAVRFSIPWRIDIATLSHSLVVSPPNPPPSFYPLNLCVWAWHQHAQTRKLTGSFHSSRRWENTDPGFCPVTCVVRDLTSHQIKRSHVYTG